MPSKEETGKEMLLCQTGQFKYYRTRNSLLVHFYNMVKVLLSVFCHTFNLKFTSYDIVMWGYSTPFPPAK